MPLAVTFFGLSLSQVLRDLGYAGLALLMLLETIFPPVPSEAILPLAGYFVERDELAFAAVLLTSTAGSALGAVLLYEAARRGRRPFARRFLRVARLQESRLEEAERWFARRGALIVLLGRCVPGMRSLVSLPAGVLRMPRWKYMLFTTIGSVVWNGVLVGIGYALGSQWEQVSDVVGSVSAPVLATTVLGATALVLWRVRRVRTQ